MKIFDWFKTRQRLIDERDYAWDTLDQARDIVMSSDILSEAKVALFKKPDPPRILPGSDLGEGKLLIKCWAVKVLAYSLHQLLEETQSENYLVLGFNSPQGELLEVTIQRAGKMNPAEKAAKLEKENQKLKELLSDS